MKKILVISDNHGYTRNIHKIIEKEHPDKVFHLGDSQGDCQEMEMITGLPVEMVKGNCDSSFYNLPIDMVVSVGNKTALLTHGHYFDVRCSLNQLRNRAQQVGADLAFYGHTHIPDIDYNYGITCACPGSTDEPRQKGRTPTYIIIDIGDDGEPKISIREI